MSAGVAPRAEQPSLAPTVPMHFDVDFGAVGLSRVPVSQAYPLLSLGYVLNAVLAWWLLGEAVTAVRMAGIGVIIVGVVLVVRS